MNNDAIRPALALTEKPYNLLYNSYFATSAGAKLGLSNKGQYILLNQTPLQKT